MQTHESITSERIADLCEKALHSTENPGICIHCGADHDACEPDGQKLQCLECRYHTVYGAEFLLLEIV